MSFEKKFLDKIILDDNESFICEIGGNLTYPIIKTLVINLFLMNFIIFSISLRLNDETIFLYADQNYLSKIYQKYFFEIVTLVFYFL